jgi:hypothetical protein
MTSNMETVVIGDQTTTVLIYQITIVNLENQTLVIWDD